MKKPTSRNPGNLRKLAPLSLIATVAALASLALLFGPAARAISVPTTAQVPHGRVTIETESRVIKPNSSVWLGFHFVLEPGWHIYWINPGDSGEPPRLNWHLPKGLTAGRISWPAPKRLPAPGVMDFGYTNDTVLLVPLHSAAGVPAGAIADLSVDIEVVVCREVCIPGHAQIALRLPVVTVIPPALRPFPQTAALFVAARRRLPTPAPIAWKISVQDGKDDFVLRVDTGKSVTSASFFPEAEQQLNNTAPEGLQPTPNGFEMRLRKSDQLTKPVQRLRGILELGNAAYAVDSPVTVPGA